MFWELSHIPIEAFRGNWLVEERDNILGVELGLEESNNIQQRFVYVKTIDIKEELRNLLNKQNTFQNSDGTWEIIELLVWDKIQQLQQKTDFIFKYIKLCYFVSSSDFMNKTNGAL